MTNENAEKWFFENAIHFIASDKPVGEMIGAQVKSDPCPVISAGHQEHAYTTGYAHEEILS